MIKIEDKIISLYLQGKSIMEIHKILNISRPRISKILKENNIKIKNYNTEEDYLKAWNVYKQNN